MKIIRMTVICPRCSTRYVIWEAPDRWGNPCCPFCMITLGNEFKAVELTKKQLEDLGVDA